MKKLHSIKFRILLFFTLTLSPCVYGQNKTTFPIDEKTGEIVYTEVVTVENVSSDVLFLRAKEWFVHTFVSAEDVLQLEDKAAGILIGKSNFRVETSFMGGGTGAGRVKFTIEINVKDGKYKYKIQDLIHDGNGEVSSHGDLRLEKPSGGIYTMGMKNWLGIKQQTNTKVLSIISSLKKAMNTSKDNDW